MPCEDHDGLAHGLRSEGYATFAAENGNLGATSYFGMSMSRAARGQRQPPERAGVDEVVNGAATLIGFCGNTKDQWIRKGEYGPEKI